MSALLERQIRRAMPPRGIPKLVILPEGRETKTPTRPRLLEKFADVTWYESQEKDRVVNFPVEINRTQRRLLDLMEVPQTLCR